MPNANESHHNAAATAAAAAEDEAAEAAANTVLQDASEGPEFSFLSDLITARRGHPQGNALPAPIVKAVLLAIADSIAALHGDDKICGLVRPWNIVFWRDGRLRFDDRVTPDKSSREDRLYWPPERLLGHVDGNTQAGDMWALGCIMGELLCGHALFMSFDVPNQLYIMFKLLGFPTKTEVEYLGSAYDDLVFPGVETSCSRIGVRFPQLDSSALALMSSLLDYSPQQRISAAAVCSHSFLSELSRLSFDASAEFSTSSPMQFVSPSFSTIKDGAYGEGPSGCNVSLLQKRGELDVEKVPTGGAISEASYVSKSENVMSKRSFLSPGQALFSGLSEDARVHLTSTPAPLPIAPSRLVNDPKQAMFSTSSLRGRIGQARSSFTSSRQTESSATAVFGPPAAHLPLHQRVMADVRSMSDGGSRRTDSIRGKRDEGTQTKTGQQHHEPASASSVRSHQSFAAANRSSRSTSTRRDAGASSGGGSSSFDTSATQVRGGMRDGSSSDLSISPSPPPPNFDFVVNNAKDVEEMVERICEVMQIHPIQKFSNFLPTIARDAKHALHEQWSATKSALKVLLAADATAKHQAMLLATRHRGGVAFVPTRVNVPIKAPVHEFADDGVAKVMSVYTRCRRTRHDLLNKLAVWFESLEQFRVEVAKEEDGEDVDYSLKADADALMRKLAAFHKTCTFLKQQAGLVAISLRSHTRSLSLKVSGGRSPAREAREEKQSHDLVSSVLRSAKSSSLYKPSFSNVSRSRSTPRRVSRAGGRELAADRETATGRPTISRPSSSNSVHAVSRDLRNLGGVNDLANGSIDRLQRMVSTQKSRLDEVYRRLARLEARMGL